MRAAALTIAIALAAVGCNEGNELATGAFDFATATGGDSGAIADAAADLSTGDLAARDCGQIVSCVLQCGTTNLTCLPQCVQNADPMAVQQAGALTLCAATNCLNLLGGDGGAGGGGMAGIFQCLLSQCGSQVSMCQGLFGLGM
jgi:hypothetical protein